MTCLILLLPLQAQDLQTHLKSHHVQLHYSSTAPSVPGKCGTCLHPMPPTDNPLPAEDGQGFAEMYQLSSDDDDEMDDAMQIALLADAALNAF